MKKFFLIICALVTMTPVTRAGDFSEGDNYTSVKLGMIGSGGRIVELDRENLGYEDLIDIFCENAILQPRACIIRSI